MPNAPQVFRDIASMRAAVAKWRAAGERIALIPTMGALHAGHASLVEAARKNAERTIVSIFVNPTQFAAGEDFGAYPRTLDADLAKLADVGADGCFAPDAAEMYRPGFATEILPGGPAAAGLEDRFRRRISPAWRWWWRNCSTRPRPTAPFSARRISNNSP